jgi:hypothetical protein
LKADGKEKQNREVGEEVMRKILATTCLGKKGYEKRFCDHMARKGGI